MGIYLIPLDFSRMLPQALRDPSSVIFYLKSVLILFSFLECMIIFKNKIRRIENILEKGSKLIENHEH